MRSREFSVQSLENSLWAFAVLQVKDSAVLDALVEGACKKANEFDPQACTNTIWSFATLAYQNQPALDIMSRRSFSISSRFTPTDLSGTCWSLATLLRRDVPLLRTVAEVLKADASTFSPQGLANTAWAFATLQVRSERVMHNISKEATRQMTELNSQGLANLMWSFAALKIIPPIVVLERVAEAVQRKLTEFRDVELATTTWSFSVLTYTGAALWRSARSASLALLLERQLSSFNAGVLVEAFACSDNVEFAWQLAETAEKHGQRPTALGLGALLSALEHRDMLHREHLLFQRGSSALRPIAANAAAMRFAAAGCSGEVKFVLVDGVGDLSKSCIERGARKVGPNGHFSM